MRENAQRCFEPRGLALRVLQPYFSWLLTHPSGKESRSKETQTLYLIIGKNNENGSWVLIMPKNFLCPVLAPAAKSHQSCPTLCDPIDGSPPGSHPWDSPGKNTGVGCHFLLQCMKVKSESEVTQLCPTLRDPMDCSLPGSWAESSLRRSYCVWEEKMRDGLSLSRTFRWGKVKVTNNQVALGRLKVTVLIP